MDDNAHETKERLIEQLDAAREEMLAVLARLGPGAGVYPGWTAKELLAHFIGWDEAVTASLRAHAGRDALPAVAVQGIDYYNAESVATRQELDYDRVAREWASARDEVKAAIRALPPDRLQVPLLFPWGMTGSVTALVAEFADHEIHHAREIRAHLAGS